MQGDLFQSDYLSTSDGANFLCRVTSCAASPRWPQGDDPISWLEGLGQKGVPAGRGARPDAPALIHSPQGWIILWGERSDRLEVVIEGRGAGVWPPQRFAGLYGQPWWGPLR
jgi:hypothetical protein